MTDDWALENRQINRNYPQRIMGWIYSGGLRLAKFGFLVSFVTFVFGFFNAQFNDRQKQAMDFVSNLRNKDFVELKSKYYKMMNGITFQSERAKYPVANVGYQKLIYDKFRNNDEYMNLFFKIHDVYYHISMCGITRLCDLQTVCILAWRDIQEFQSDNGKIYEEWNLSSHFDMDFALRKLDKTCDKTGVVFLCLITVLPATYQC